MLGECPALLVPVDVRETATLKATRAENELIAAFRPYYRLCGNYASLRNAIPSSLVRSPAKNSFAPRVFSTSSGPSHARFNCRMP
jgi:hypothetical protein